ncbi:MAG: nitroreductase [Gammaproteobacteria bacterium]|nr:nitroreductase [Gammaproteobacteria bacterium]
MPDHSIVTSPVAELLRGRRTIHTFLPELPPRELLLEAIDLARWAPNHGLTEPWHFYLLGKETAQAIARLNAALVSAAHGEAAGLAKLERWLTIPGWLVVTCDNASDPIRAHEDYAACCCAVHNFALYLWSEGVGVKWTTGAVTRDPGFYDLIWVDPHLESVVGLLWYGYPAEIPQTPRKPVAEFLVELP